jgi:hypothetical protein
VARITLYIVQTFVESDQGLVAEEPFECRSAGEARWRAQHVALSKAGVIACDPDTGEWDDDSEILFRGEEWRKRRSTTCQVLPLSGATAR